MAAIQPLARLGQGAPAPDDPGDPASPSYQTLLLRKQIAEMLAKRGDAGQGGNLSIGGGIRELGYAFGDQQRQAALLQQAQRQATLEDQRINAVPTQPQGTIPPIQMQPGAPLPDVATPPAPAPATPAPAPQAQASPLFMQSANAHPSYDVSDDSSTQPSPETLMARDQITLAEMARRQAAEPAGGGAPLPFSPGPSTQSEAPTNAPVMAAGDDGDAGTPPIILAGFRDTPPRPSQQPIAPAPAPRDVGLEPIQPSPVPLFPEQLKLMQIMQSGSYSPEARAAAAEKFKIWEKYRTDQQELQQQQFKYLRSQRDDALEKNRGEPIEYQTKQLGIEKAQADLADQYYKQGLPRQQAETKAALDIQELQNKLAGPADVRDLNGAIYTRRQGEQGYARAPGSPAPVLTAQQQDAVNFATSVRPDLEDLKNSLDNGKALTDPKQAAYSHLPFGLGRATTSPEFHASMDKLGNFAAAFLKMRSGSAVSPSEAMRTLPSIMPQVGDTDADLAAKARRRDLLVDSATGAAGPEAKRIADEVVAEYNRNRPPPTGAIHVNTPDEARRLPPGTPIILPDGRHGMVPR
jgi:hypothetical protein